jgi:hypothetical protein
VTLDEPDATLQAGSGSFYLHETSSGQVVKEVVIGGDGAATRGGAVILDRRRLPPIGIPCIKQSAVRWNDSAAVVQARWACR